jgi:hypothetical protein
LQVPVEAHEAEGVELLGLRLAEGEVEAGLHRRRLAHEEDAQVHPRPRRKPRRVRREKFARPQRARAPALVRHHLTRRQNLVDLPARVPALARRVGLGERGREVYAVDAGRLFVAQRAVEGATVAVLVERLFEHGGERVRLRLREAMRVVRVPGRLGGREDAPREAERLGRTHLDGADYLP